VGCWGETRAGRYGSRSDVGGGTKIPPRVAGRVALPVMDGTTPEARTPAHRRHRLAWGLGVLFLIAYGWFFQGGGWNQNSRFDVVRAVVELGTLEITPFAENTGDVSRVGTAIYSNKPPGPSILAAPVYAVARWIEEASGIDPARPYAQTANAHLITWFVAGLPGAALVALIFLYLCAVTGSERQALLMAAAFGMGSLALPYSGVLMNHLLVAAGLFAAWTALEVAAPTRSVLLLGGAALGVALFSEYLALPLVALYALVWWQRRAALGTAAPFFWVGPVMGLVVVLAMNAALFGSPFRISYEVQNAAFLDSGLLLGMIDAPDPRRLWWLTFQPYRGLFWCSPMFALVLLGPGRLHTRRRVAFCLAIALYFLLFNLVFNGWTGGWGVGPRYLIPALPFLFVLVAEPWGRYRVVRSIAVGLSILFMTAATTALVMVPGPTLGPPPAGRDPVRETLVLALGGAVSLNEQAVFEYLPRASADPAVDDQWDSYNLGELMGLGGLWSVLPLLLLVGGGVAMLERQVAKSEEATTAG
jgi:hypothetical protein